MTCNRCGGSGKIYMYYGENIDGTFDVVKPKNGDDIKRVIVDREEPCWLCRGTGNE